MIFLTPLILIHNFHTKGILQPKRSLVDITSGCFVEAESNIKHIVATESRGPGLDAAVGACGYRVRGTSIEYVIGRYGQQQATIHKGNAGAGVEGEIVEVGDAATDVMMYVPIDIAVDKEVFTDSETGNNPQAVIQLF